ncbi:MAG TPA: hypothetical protein VKV73_07520, partial [Chloroflexota bacterium]|nr:hypothetical protein [Chloroflexota bacterium]
QASKDWQSPTKGSGAASFIRISQYVAIRMPGRYVIVTFAYYNAADPQVAAQPHCTGTQARSVHPHVDQTNPRRAALGRHGRRHGHVLRRRFRQQRLGLSRMSTKTIRVALLWAAMVAAMVMSSGVASASSGWA